MPSEEYVRVPPERDTFDTKCPNIAGHFQQRASGKEHGRVPRAVTSDKSLRDRDTRVYEALAQLERGGYVRCGIRLIGETCNKSKSQVARSLAKLIARGYVDSFVGKRGQRTAYKLTSVIFKAALEPPAVQPKRRGKVQLRPCSKCRKPCRPNKATGWCRRCMTDSHTRMVVREEVARIGAPVEETA